MQPDDPRADGAKAGGLRLFGVPIRLHVTFLLFFAFLVFVGVSRQQSVVTTVLYLVGLFGSVLLHELGHALVARRYGIQTVEIVMFPIGGLAKLARAPKASEELWIAIAGPAVNIAIAAVFLAALMVRGVGLEPGDLSLATDANLVHRIIGVNLALALFNLLPAFPMDGGRILRAILAKIKKNEDEATRIAAATGRLLAFVMGLYGLLSANFMLVFIAFFVYVGAAQEGAAALGRSLTHGVPVRAAMVTDFRTLPHGSTVGDAANLLLATSQQDFPVVHGDQVIGLLNRSGLVRAMAGGGSDSYVSGAMDRGFVRLGPEMDLAEALPLMAGAGSCALVMEEERLLGLLTSENLSEFLLLRRVGLNPTRPQAA